MSTYSPPDTCNLPPRTFRHRIAQIERLTAKSLISHRRDDLTLHLAYWSSAAKAVRELVELERDCCSFITFVIEETYNEIRLTLVAPERARESALLMFSHYEPKDPSKAESCSAVPVNGVCCPTPVFEGVS